MSESCSPVKVGPPDSKRERRGINLSQCIICQKYSSENLTNFGIKGNESRSYYTPISKSKLKTFEDYKTEMQDR